MAIFKLVGGRLLTSIFTLLLVSVLVFLMLEVLPGDVATRILGRGALPDAVELLRQKLHLDDPAILRYGRWLFSILSGDLGNSLVSNRPIADILTPRIMNTAYLSICAFVLYVPLTLIPAMIQALNRDRAIDHSLSAITLLLLSMPDFLLATILLIIFVVAFPILPPVSLVDGNSSPLEFFRAMALPALTLAIAMSGFAIRMLRDNLIEVLESDYIRMAQLRGLSRWSILLRHALPNAAAPTLTVTALNLAYLVGGVVVVEKVFGFPGFGSLLVDSIQLRDLPLIEITIMTAAAVYIAANLIADVASVLLNPKLREA